MGSQPMIAAPPTGTPNWTVGEEVEVWSKSNNAWCLGRTVHVDDLYVTCQIRLPSGTIAHKKLPLDNPEVRRVLDSGLAVPASAPGGGIAGGLAGLMAALGGRERSHTMDDAGWVPPASNVSF